MTPLSSSVATISDGIHGRKSMGEKSITSPIRPSSPYRARISANGEPLLSETVIADTKEKTSTGETNSLVSCSKLATKTCLT